MTCTHKKDVEGLSCGFELYKFASDMSDVIMLLMTDAKLIIFNVKTI